MTNVLRRFTFAVAALAALATSQVANASSATLAELLVPGATLVCGDKIFSNFGRFNTFGTGGATAPTAAEINVSCNELADGSVELVFSSAKWNVNAGQTMDTFFGFQVDVAPGIGKSIERVEASLLGFSTSGDGNIHLDEAVFGSSSLSPFLGTIGLDTDAPAIVTGGLNIDPVRKSLYITKDLALDGGLTGRASISQFSQRFIQTPEPSSVALVGVGATLLLGYGWRRRKSS
jgi:hypothetical protein